MLDRYSDDARRAVGLAHDEARRLGHGHVGTEHLLLGLLAEGDNPASRSLQRAGASLALCREKVTEALASRSGATVGDPPGLLELTDRASRALDRAGRLSARLKSDRVETSHMLISVLDVEGTAGQVLRGLSVDLAAVREGLAAPGADPSPAEEDAVAGGTPTAMGSGDTPVSSGPGSVDPVCATCGAPLDSSLGHAVVASTGGVDFDVAYCTMCGATFGATRSVD